MYLGYSSKSSVIANISLYAQCFTSSRDIQKKALLVQTNKRNERQRCLRLHDVYFVPAWPPIHYRAVLCTAITSCLPARRLRALPASESSVLSNFRARWTAGTLNQGQKSPKGSIRGSFRSLSKQCRLADRTTLIVPKMRRTNRHTLGHFRLADSLHFHKGDILPVDVLAIRWYAEKRLHSDASLLP